MICSSCLIFYQFIIFYSNEKFQVYNTLSQRFMSYAGVRINHITKSADFFNGHFFNEERKSSDIQMNAQKCQAIMLKLH